MKKYALTLLLGALGLTGCLKADTTVDVTVSVRPAIVSLTEGPTGAAVRDTTHTDRWDAYWFYADTLGYENPTREDAAAGLLRPLVPSEAVMTPSGEAEVVAADTAIYFRHLTAPAILVVWQPELEAAAWRVVEPVGGLSALDFALWIRPPANDTTFVYTENGWTVELKPTETPEP